MKLPVIAIIVFAACATTSLPAAARSNIEAYSVSNDSGNAYFVPTFGKFLENMVEPETGSVAGMLLVDVKDPHQALTTSNLLSLPPGRVRIKVHRISSGASLRFFMLSQTGSVTTQSLVKLAQKESGVNAAPSQQSFIAEVPPGNKALLVELVRANFLGINAPAIATVEASYEQMWAQDVSSMIGYNMGSSATANSLLEQIDSSAPQ